MTDKRSLRLFHQIIALATDDRLNTVEFFQNFRGRLSPVKEGDKEKNGGRHGERGEKSGIGAGGDLSEIIRNLVTSGFVLV